ncbi:MAG: DNA cytosine methyltransferase [Actinomycetia bacterium]|nr:DNA cytosine methyltransferase [Actinomycetes bacterium]
MARFTSVEVCAGAGGQAVGLDRAGFDHWACVEIDKAACETLRANKPDWQVIETDLRSWEPDESLIGVDLLAGGVPCPPFSIAGAQLGRPLYRCRARQRGCRVTGSDESGRPLPAC